MLLQLFAALKITHKSGDNVLLARQQALRRSRVNGREITVQQRIYLAPAAHRSGVIVDLAQIVALLHLKIGVAGNHLRFEFQHQHRDRLVHPGDAREVRRADVGRVRVGVRHPAGQVTLGVVFLRVMLQTAQRNAVAALQRIHIVVRQRRFQHRQDAQRAARRRAHPHHIVISPLEVHIVVLVQAFKNHIRTWAAVEQVAHNVQPVNRQTLHHLAQGDDVLIRQPIAQHTRNDFAIILFLVVILEVRVEQLVENVAALLGHHGAHVPPRVLAGHQPAEVNQLQQHPLIPAVEVVLTRFQFRQLLPRIVDKGCQIRALLRRGRIAQQAVDFLPDDPRRAVENMDEGFMLAVQVAHKMLCALGQTEQRLQADDFAVRGQGSRIFFRQQGQVAQPFGGVFTHRILLLCCEQHCWFYILFPDKNVLRCEANFSFWLT